MRAVVTGAASGIGLGVARRFAADHGAGAGLLLMDRNRDGLTEAGVELARTGARIETFAGDLADPAACEQTVSRAIACFGGLDVLVSNAGINPKFALADYPVEAFDLVQRVNLRATWLLGRAALPHLAQAKGAIVAIASVAGSHPTPMCGAYSVSKAGLIMLVRQMALEWGPLGVRSNLVSPGSVPTGMSPERYATDEGRALARSRNPLGVLGEVADIAAAVAYLAGPEARFVNGANLVVDGGMVHTTMRPGAAILPGAAGR